MLQNERERKLHDQFMPISFFSLWLLILNV
jgi:hypothetical protein